MLMEMYLLVIKGILKKKLTISIFTVQTFYFLIFMYVLLLFVNVGRNFNVHMSLEIYCIILISLINNKFEEKFCDVIRTCLLIIEEFYHEKLYFEIFSAHNL